MLVSNFIGGTYEHRSVKESAQKCVNFYPEIVPSAGAKSKLILVGTPGTELICDVSSITSGSCRGLHYTSTSRTYGVFGSHLIRFNTNLTVEKSWLISGGTTFVSFADNGKYLMFTDGATMWQFNMETDALQGQPDLPETLVKPQMIKYIGQRFVAFGEDSNQFWWSAVGPDGPLTWEGTAFASAEGSADHINAIGVSDGEMVVFGPRSLQVFRLTGDDASPFSFVGGSFTNIGCGAPWSVAEIMGEIYWLGSSSAGKNQVFKMRGYTPEVISDTATSTTLEALDALATTTLNTTSDAVGFAYQQNNQVFYVLNLRQANRTLCYGVSTGLWHERSSYDPRTRKEGRYEYLFCVYAHDRILVGSNRGPYLLRLALDIYQEYNGSRIKRVYASPSIWEDQDMLIHQDFILDSEPGVGNTSGPGNDPQAMLRWSDDGGFTWSSEKWRSVGKVGRYKAYVRWNGLGRARDRVYELTVSDPVKWVILAASIRAIKTRGRGV